MEKRINPLELKKEEVAITSANKEPKKEKTVAVEQPVTNAENANNGRSGIAGFFSNLFKKGAKK